jgi:membrane protease subunit HflK
MTNSSKIMIDVEGGNNMMYLPLDQILQNSRRNQGNVSVTELELPAGRNLATESQSVRPVPLRGSQR